MVFTWEQEEPVLGDDFRTVLMAARPGVIDVPGAAGQPTCVAAIGPTADAVVDVLIGAGQQPVEIPSAPEEDVDESSPEEGTVTP